MAPAEEYSPTGQLMQVDSVVAAVAVECFPASQDVHADAASPEYLPASHPMHVDAASPEYLPASHPVVLVFFFVRYFVFGVWLVFFPPP